MHAPATFLNQVGKVAKEYPEGPRHMLALRAAMERGRLDDVEGALVQGLLARAMHDARHRKSLMQAWYSFRQWHDARPPNGLKGLPVHLFNAHIAKHLSMANTARMQQAFKANNPVRGLHGERKAAVDREMRWWAKVGVALTKLTPAQGKTAVAKLAAAQGYRDEDGYAPKITVEPEPTGGRSFECYMFGPYFGVGYGTHESGDSTVAVYTRKDARKFKGWADTWTHGLLTNGGGNVDRSTRALLDLNIKFVSMVRTPASRSLRVGGVEWDPDWLRIVKAAAREDASK